MGSAKYFTSISIHSGYWKYCIFDKNILKSIFLTRCSLYEWVIMPIGLTNTPAPFLHTMNNLFSDILDSSIAVFLDSNLVYVCRVK